MEILEIGRNDAGQRLDKYLTKALPLLPKSLMYKYIRLKKIKVNRKRTEISHMLCEGDTVQLFIREEFLTRSGGGELFRQLTPVIDVIYEDENLLLCYKPVGMLCQPDDGGERNTLSEHIKAYLYRKKEYDPDGERSFAPALCNRIDRNTEGIVIAAKNAAALREANEAIRSRDVKKYYICLVHGIPDPPSADLKGWLIKDGDANTVRIFRVRPKEGDAKQIETKYRTLYTETAAGRDPVSTLEVELVTGRTHQIRAHLAFIGHPLVGDGKYAVNKEDRKHGFSSQALCAYKVVFLTSGETLGYMNGREFVVPKEKIGFLNR